MEIVVMGTSRIGSTERSAPGLGYTTNCFAPLSSPCASAGYRVCSSKSLSCGGVFLITDSRIARYLLPTNLDSLLSAYFLILLSRFALYLLIFIEHSVTITIVSQKMLLSYKFTGKVDTANRVFRKRKQST